MKIEDFAVPGPQHPNVAGRATPWFIAATVVALVFVAPAAKAQTGDAAPRPRTTMAGVFTAEQANRGADTYASICLSCHTIAEQTGKEFAKKWVGFPVWDLYDYLSVNMPQSDPGTLNPKEYAQVVAYMLKINGMPAGKQELASDTLALKMIKVDTMAVDTIARASRERLKGLLRSR